MKCYICGTRKGKRYCPAGRTQICPQCCGEKRVVEIACPPDCIYLSSGQSYQAGKKLTAQMLAEEDPVRRQRIYLAGQQFAQELFDLEVEIIRFAAGLSSLGDGDIMEAVETVRQTYQTEEKGLIYEHQSANPLAQSLAQELRQYLEKQRVAGQRQAVMKLGDILLCLEVLEHEVRFHLDHKADRDSYLRSIRRNHPESSAAEPQSRIIQI
jgi:hypothetical protein